MFRSVVDFKMEQRYNDLVIVNEIVRIRQRNLLKSWERVTIKRTATKLLTYHSEKAVKCIVLRSMINRFNYQNSCVSYMRCQEKYYSSLTAFNRLKLAVSKRKNIEYSKKTIEDRKEYWTQKKAFMHWLRKYKTLKRNYTTYAF
jgi:hypothetical protein